MNKIMIDLLRHGSAAEGIKLLGRTDEPLSELGWQQLRSTTITDQVHWEKIISSPLQRCSHFAEELSCYYSLPLAIEENFQEIDFGDWDGQLLTQLYSSVEAVRLEQFISSPASITPPNGEKFQQFRSRVLTAWTALLASLKQEQSDAALLITHGGVIRVILSDILGLPDTHLFRLDVPYACLTRIIQYDDYPPVLHFHNGQLVTM